MAQLTSTLINGALRVTGNCYGNMVSRVANVQSKGSNGWFKFAEAPLDNTYAVGVWQVTSTLADAKPSCGYVRFSRSSSGTVKMASITSVTDSSLPVNICVRYSSTMTELWCNPTGTWRAVTFTEVTSGQWSIADSSGKWTYYSGETGSTAKPTSDSTWTVSDFTGSSVALTSRGSDTNPVYVDGNGAVQKCYPVLDDTGDAVYYQTLGYTPNRGSDGKTTVMLISYGNIGSTYGVYLVKFLWRDTNPVLHYTMLSAPSNNGVTDYVTEFGYYISGSNAYLVVKKGKFSGAETVHVLTRDQNSSGGFTVQVGTQTTTRPSGYVAATQKGAPYIQVEDLTSGTEIRLLGATGVTSGCRDAKMYPYIRAYADSSNGNMLLIGNDEGTGGVADKGRIRMAGGAGHYGTLQTAAITLNQLWTLPNASGTIALTSDVAAYTVTFGGIGSTITADEWDALKSAYQANKRVQCLVSGHVNSVSSDVWTKRVPLDYVVSNSGGTIIKMVFTMIQDNISFSSDAASAATAAGQMVQYIIDSTRTWSFNYTYPYNATTSTNAVNALQWDGHPLSLNAIGQAAGTISLV